MSAGEHERQRLSAYLDGELPAAEAAVVAAHVAGCAECAALLADMAAVDERFADAPVETPEGYFDAYASRVRTRIEAEPRRAPRRLPAWTWAVAAVLVLAVVTPLTLRGRVAAPPVSAPLETTVGVPAPATAARAEPAGRRDAATPAPELAGAADERKEEQARAATGGTASRRQEPVAPRQEATGPEPARRVTAAAPAPAAPAAQPPAGPALESERLGEAATRADEAANAAVAPPSAAGGAVGPLQEAPRPAAAPAVAPLAGDAVVGYGVTASAESRAKTAAADALGRETAGASFSRLTSVAPRTAAEWRQARESWRAFAAAHPADPRADEARVRAVEAAFEAWRAAGDAADRRAFESDARAYLARGDAAQRERVSALVRRAESPGR